jgi:hypothetical protein
VFKKALAILAAVVLGAGLSVIAVAAPASAHTPTKDVTCNSLWFQADSYETKQGNPTPNSVTITIDGGTPTVYNFGGSLSKKTFNFDGTTSHTWSIVVDAVGGSGPDTQYDVSYSGVTTPCTYPSKDLDVSCSAVVIDWGKKLENGLHINLEVETLAGIKQIHANFDLNIPGGYNGLGIRFTDYNGVETLLPLTEQQVKSGHFEWNFTTYLGGATGWKVRWAQFNDLHWNDPIVVANILSCDWKTPVTVSGQVSATPPSSSSHPRPASSGAVAPTAPDPAPTRSSLPQRPATS